MIYNFPKEYKYLIAFAGRSATGKTVAANYFKSLFGNSTVLAFADGMKEIALELYPDFPREAFYGEAKDKEVKIGNYPLTGREILIKLGTKIREVVGDHVWVTVLAKKVQQLFLNNIDFIFIDDLRFPIEANELYGMEYEPVCCTTSYTTDPTIKSYIIKLECPNRNSSNPDLSVDSILQSRIFHTINCNTSENAQELKKELDNLLYLIYNDIIQSLGEK